jgi:hypothetical protein
VTTIERVREAARRVIANRWVRAAGRLWATVRPTSRREAAIGLALVAGGSAVLAVVFLVAATVLWSPYVESVVEPEADARAWAALEPTYAGSATCARCHPTEAARAQTAGHAAIGCESCHGPMDDHARSEPGFAVAVTLDLPTDALCATCHAATIGRPTSIRQIVPADHYVAACLECHDPHTAISRRPPVVVHPLDHLPACITCHGPDGFKARNQRHPVVSGDEPCLACHAPGRGPGDDQ